MNADVPGTIQRNAGRDISNCLLAGGAFNPNGVVSLIGSSFTVHRNLTGLAGGHFGIRAVCADMNADIILAVNINLAIITDSLTRIGAAVMYRHPVVW